MENEYQLRMKSLAHNEIIKEMTDKFHQEIETLKQRNQVRRHACSFHVILTWLIINYSSVLTFGMYLQFYVGDTCKNFLQM